VIFLFLSGCSKFTGQEDFNDIIDNIQQSVEQKEWKQLKSHGDDLLKIYHSNKWKLQMIGDEREYEELYESIKRLLVVIEEKEVTEIKLSLATIESIIEEIYSL